MTSMRETDKVRRAGYAPRTAALGRRGMHTRDRIVSHASRLFCTHGYQGTSIDAIAKAVGGSRATVYQYFKSKDEIFLELLGRCEPAVLDHARRLRHLGPDAEGIANLHRWMVELADLHDRYAMVFMEFPGIGLKQGLPPARARTVSDQYAETIADKLSAAGVCGLQPADAAGALLCIAHMVNLYRSREMFGLRSADSTSASLTIAMQLLLFPDTPVDVIGLLPAVRQENPASMMAGVVGAEPVSDPDPATVSPIRQDMVSAASALFAERGYHAVSMGDIAAAAEVSRATLYRHFSTKVTILSELTEWAVLEGWRVSAALVDIAQGNIDAETLRGWLSHYVRFHRSYGSVIRAWYDGTVAQQLPEDTVSSGLGTFNRAVAALLRRIDLPAGMDPTVAAAVFLSVLGRLTERTVSQHSMDSDYDTACFLLLVLQRSLLGAEALPEDVRVSTDLVVTIRGDR
jgi:AcrR family transcriptional regulator